MQKTLITAASLAALLFAAALGAQPAPEGDGATPRAAMLEFLTACRAGDYEDAARYLDLRHLSPAQRAEGGPALARRVKAVLDRTLWVELEALSDVPDGDSDDGLAPGLERVGTIEVDDGPSVECWYVAAASRGGASPR